MSVTGAHRIHLKGKCPVGPFEVRPVVRDTTQYVVHTFEKDNHHLTKQFVVEYVFEFVTIFFFFFFDVVLVIQERCNRSDPLVS